MQDKRDVDAFFRHMFYIHRMALQTMRHVNGVVRCVLYLFYFLALPFSYPFLIIAVLLYSNPYDLQGKVYNIYGQGQKKRRPCPFNAVLDIQQLLLTVTFACQFFRLFFFTGDFTDTTNVCTCSNWNQTTNNQVFVDTNQFIS